MGDDATLKEVGDDDMMAKAMANGNVRQMET
jgi:hypothetical protein